MNARDTSPPHQRFPWLGWLLGQGVILVVIVFTGRFAEERPQFEPDDFRYLALLQQEESSPGRSILDQWVVENSWRHLWWMDVAANVRFFRPTVFESFRVDRIFHGAGARGVHRTNVVLHGITCLLASALLFRALRSRLAALAASTLFASFYCHGETLWYASGRTDSLAALFFLTGLTLHVGGSHTHRWLRGFGPAAFLLALFSKELTVVLPVLLLLHDRWTQRSPSSWFSLLKKEKRLYAAYAMVALLSLLLRQMALAGRGDGALVFPYFVSPGDPAQYLTHVFTQLRAYSENLLFARYTPPFVQPETVGQFTSWGKFALGMAVACAVIAITWKRRRMWFFAVLGFTTWLPTSVAYVSERYLLLPSLALAGAIGLFLENTRPRRWLFRFFVVMVFGWAAHQAWQLDQKNRFYSSPHLPRVAEVISRRCAPFRDSVAQGKELLFVNFPSNWVHAQFLQDQLRIVLNLPAARARVLTLMPESQKADPLIQLRKKGERTVEIHATSSLMEHRDAVFPWVSMRPGEQYDLRGMDGRITVIEGDVHRLQTFQVDLPRPLENYLVLTFVPPDNPTMSRSEQLLRGQIKELQVP